MANTNILKKYDFEQMKAEFLKVYHITPSIENAAAKLAWQVTTMTENPAYWNGTYESMKEDLETHDLETLLRLIWDFWKHGKDAADFIYNEWVKSRLAYRPRKENPYTLEYNLKMYNDYDITIYSNFWIRTHKGSTWLAVLDEKLLKSSYPNIIADCINKTAEFKVTFKEV